jgi:hypothetical protein
MAERVERPADSARPRKFTAKTGALRRMALMPMRALRHWIGTFLLGAAAVAQAAPFAYITRADGAVAVIDTATQDIVAVIGSGGRPEAWVSIPAGAGPTSPIA